MTQANTPEPDKSLRISMSRQIGSAAHVRYGSDFGQALPLLRPALGRQP